MRLGAIYQSSEAKKRDNRYVKISLQHLHTKDQISLLFLGFDTTKKRELVF